MILYRKDLKNATKKFLDTMNSCSKVVGYKMNLQKSIAFLSTKNKQFEKIYRKIITFTIASQNKIPRNKLNKGCERSLQGKLNH
jgi:hypothetical protein